jgi:Rrf2 family protein
MKFSAQEEYGLRCILSLARAEMRSASMRSASQPQAPATLPSASDLPFLTVTSIARSEGLSVQYAGKLIRILGKAGLVESVRGCKGGYRLARPPAAISVAEVLAALGGKIYEAETCGRYTGDRRFCVHTNDCSIRSLWSGLQLLVDQVLSRSSLADLIGTEKTMSQWLRANTQNMVEWLEPRAALPESRIRRALEDMPTAAETSAVLPADIPAVAAADPQELK